MTNALKLEHISVGEMDNNCYLLHDGTHALLIDAADDAPALLALARDANVSIEAVLTTHRHWDHVRALEEVLQETGATHYASFLDSPALPAPVDVELQHGDHIPFAGLELPVIILRGHTPGGAALAAPVAASPADAPAEPRTNLFVGDSLFPGGVGKTNSENDFVRLYKDVTQRLFDVYPDDAVVRPGHGKATTLGAERSHLAQWWERRW